nr:HAMP domain-containing sensor histidine kinase [uncultured Halomonas sp.]
MKRDTAGPTLMQQLTLRLVVFTFIFAIFNIGLVVWTYVSQPEALGEQLLTMEASRLESSTVLTPDNLVGPPGAQRWSARYIDPTSPNLVGQDGRGSLMDWTRRERLEHGVRIIGVRRVERSDQPQWLWMEMEADSLRPFIPVILNEILAHVAMPLIPLLGLMLTFNVLAVRRVLQPLHQAEKEIEVLDPEKMTMRLTEPFAPREVKALVHTVNRALQRLEEAMVSLKSFTSNAAHELRTPLSILQLSLERLPESHQRNELQLDVSQISRMVDQMLDLTRADAMAFDTGTIVDLADIGRNVVSDLTPKAYAANRELRFEDHGPAIARGHAEAIYRIYRNLIDNAFLHAPGETSIEVFAGPGPKIGVRDHGPGISDADAQKIFEQFWRKDRRKHNGAGLGLGIVRRLADAHQGSVSVKSSYGSGALFTVQFQEGISPEDGVP